MKKPTPQKSQAATSFTVLRAARRLIDDGVINYADLAKRVGISDSTLAAMLHPDYSNKTLTALDSIRAVVLDIRASQKTDA